jgi:3-dehydroquinate synthase
MPKPRVFKLKRDSIVITGESIDNLARYVKSNKLFIITDSNVYAHHAQRFPKGLVHVIQPGEKSKSLDEALVVYHWLLDYGADRHSFILGIGGGVVCDLAGFVASTFMRGLNFGFVATSLLAQVDASVGGKNGINIDGYKNIVGTFNLPKFTICDTDLLSTLPPSERSNGFAEIVKHTLIADQKMFWYIEQNVTKLKEFNEKLLRKLVEHSISIKARVVKIDEKEEGIRKVLNLGHTWGHAVEKVSGISHGNAVSIGIEFDARLSNRMGVLSEADYLRVVNILTSLGLPVYSSACPTLLFEALTKDKKKAVDSIDLTLLNGIGSVRIERVSLNYLKSLVLG